MSVLGTVKTDLCLSSITTSASASFGSVWVDTLGFNNALFVVANGTSAQEMASGHLEESDELLGTYTAIENTTLDSCIDVDGAVVTLSGFTLASNTVVFDLALLKRKRFLKFAGVNGGATRRVGMLCFLFNPSNIGTDTEADYAICEYDANKVARVARI